MGTQMNTSKIITSLAVLIQLALTHCMAQSPVPALKFIIVTQERFGFKKDRDFYTLGTKLGDFRARFGAAERSEKDDSDDGYLAHTVTDYYDSNGLMVTAKADGTIIGFIFYLIPSSSVKIAPAATDRGIAAGPSET